jgi:hydroxymethylpyrimidine pyrophosphatase-like HAD family hydrolase
MSSLMETLGRAGLSVEPDFLVLVEREIFLHSDSHYAGLTEWNLACEDAHAELFARVIPDLPRIVSWIEARFHACIYEDAFSPFCLIANNNGEADAIHAYLDDYCREKGELTVVRNDVYARFSHTAFNKGTALAELTRRQGLTRDEVFAVGDHLNDLPMLSSQYARFLAAPSNAVPPVKELVLRQGGYVSPLSHGNGVADALEHHLGRKGG